MNAFLWCLLGFLMGLWAMGLVAIHTFRPLEKRVVVLENHIEAAASGAEQAGQEELAEVLRRPLKEGR